jgi:hypothetical protein
MTMLKYMTGLTVEEFSQLYVLLLPGLQEAFPKTPEHADAGADGSHMTLRLLLYLTLQRLRHLTSFRFLQGTVGFSYGHLCDTLNRCEEVMLRFLEPYLRKPTLAELQHDAEIYWRTKPLNGLRFRIGFLVDATYYVLCRPLDDAIQEVLYTRYKRIHAIKLSVVCAVHRRWIYEAHPFVGRTSDMTAWREQPFASMITPECGVLGLTDKGMNDYTEVRLVTPFKATQVRAHQRQVHTWAERDAVKRACKVFNMQLGSHRVHNEIMIGDLCRWGAARGCGFKKTYSDLESAKLRIEVCRGLTNFVYRARQLG